MSHAAALRIPTATPGARIVVILGGGLAAVLCLGAALALATLTRSREVL